VKFIASIVSKKNWVNNLSDIQTLCERYLAPSLFFIITSKIHSSVFLQVRAHCKIVHINIYPQPKNH